jgi:S-adenosylmethionine:tRNA ribosyltransferase-isomerase
MQVTDRDYLVDSYDYTLPEELIAKEPLYPKESAKLLVYNRGNRSIIHTTFGNVLHYLPKDISILFNNTKVIKARVFGKKSSGGAVEVLINRPVGEYSISIFIKGRVKVGTEIMIGNEMTLTVIQLLEDGSRIGEFYRDGIKLEFSQLVELIEEIGHIPLPPYIDRPDNQSDESDYQTVFAKEMGAVASPTASLHFSEEMLREIENRFQTAYLTLHVGAGTFKPVDVDDIREHNLHREIFQISDRAKDIIDSKQNILAVGTTVTRTVEYYIRSGEREGDADLFLHPNNLPKRVNHLLTNFHLPKSTLLMLVSSFVGIDEMKRIYSEAIRERYRFFSYGDAMLII